MDDVCGKMYKINSPNYRDSVMKIQNGKLFLLRKHYDLQAIQRAMYDLSEKVIFHLSESDEYYIISNTQLENDFEFASLEMLYKSILDHQLRIELEIKFGSLRNLLIAKALESNLNIRSYIKEFSSEE
ncbi:hypothetical protein ADMFC3_19130 [Geovibrio sp. ADMFC3]